MFQWLNLDVLNICVCSRWWTSTGALIQRSGIVRSCRDYGWNYSKNVWRLQPVHALLWVYMTFHQTLNQQFYVVNPKYRETLIYLVFFNYQHCCNYQFFCLKDRNKSGTFILTSLTTSTDTHGQPISIFINLM